MKLSSEILIIVVESISIVESTAISVVEDGKKLCSS